MNTLNQIQAYITSQPEAKARDMELLHNLILQTKPDAKLRFLDGKNEQGKVVSNPNIGYGSYMIHYADGSTKEFYQVGLSANTNGISVYIMGLTNKNYLTQTFGERLGKASVTGYCIKFKALKDVDSNLLMEAVRYGFEDHY